MTKRPVQFLALALLLLAAAGCASSGALRDVSPLVAAKPFDLNVILVQTASPLPGLTAEKQMLNDAIASGLRDTHLFKSVSANRADLGAGSGITVTATITRIKAISRSERQWAGAMAGRAKIWVHVAVSDLNSAQPMQTFDVYGESSGGSNLAGTTDEAIDRAAEPVVAQVTKINAQTAQ
jgi:hypothetical protein